MLENNTRLYELGFLLIPTIPETEVETQVNVLTGAIEAAGGKIASKSNPEFIDLAYQMEQSVGSKKMKWTQGYFGWIKFEGDPEIVETLKKVLDLNTNVIRYILLKTSVENTVVFKKPKIDPKREQLPAEEVIDEAELEAIEAEEDALEHEKLPDLEADIAEDLASPEEA